MFNFGGSQRSSTRSGKQYHRQSVAQLSADEQIAVRTLKDQVDSLFDMFGSCLEEALSASPDQRTLRRLNDATMANLKLFGKGCQRHKKKREDKILCAVFAHFERKHASVPSANRQIIASFLQYAEAALTSKAPLPQMRISKETIRVAKKDTLTFLPGIFNNFLGATHETEAQVDDVRKNTARYARENAAAVGESKGRFEQTRNTASFPSQEAMYNLSGGGSNVQFASSLDSFGKYAKQANEDAKEGDAQGMELDEAEARSANAYIKEAPRGKVKGSNGKIQYPMPCQIEKQVSQRSYRVLLAAPHCISVDIKIDNLERKQEKVRKTERAYNQQVLGGKGLGYLSIDEIDAKAGYPIYHAQ